MSNSSTQSNYKNRESYLETYIVDDNFFSPKNQHRETFKMSLEEAHVLFHSINLGMSFLASQGCFCS